MSQNGKQKRGHTIGILLRTGNNEVLMPPTYSSKLLTTTKGIHFIMQYNRRQCNYHFTNSAFGLTPFRRSFRSPLRAALLPVAVDGAAPVAAFAVPLLVVGVRARA
jgi:hypothetical protein